MNTSDPKDYTPISLADAGDTASTGIPNTVNPTALTNNAYGFLEQFEGVVGNAYVDGKDYPTVGIGFLLYNAPLAQQVYLTSELGVRSGTTEYTDLVDDLDKNTWSSKTALDDALNTIYGSTIPVLTAAQEVDMWNRVVLSTNSQSQYEKFLGSIKKSTYHIDAPDLLNSKEGVALFSLSYNGILAKSPTLLSDLNENNFNRPDGWFQIRYNSNGGGSNGSVAARRYAESEVFGLYSPSDTSASDVTNTEALKIYEELSRPTSGSKAGETDRDFAFNYEHLFTAYPSGNSSVDEIVQANDSLSVPSGYIESSSLAISGTTVTPLSGELQWAADKLVSTYITDASLNPYAGSTFGPSSISSLDVQVALASGGSDLIASQRSGYELGTGGFLPSLLIANGGSDTLDASASSANVALIGGTGNDRIASGTGNDYIVAGTGNDSITLIGGNDTVVLGESDSFARAGHDTVDATHDAGSVAYYVGIGTNETIKLGSGTSTLNLVKSLTGGVANMKTVTFHAQQIAPYEWFDSTDDVLVKQLPDPTSGILDPNAATKDLVVIFGASGSSSLGTTTQAIRRLSLAQLQQVAATAAGTGTTPPAIELTLENFTGSSDAGLTLVNAPAGPTLPGSSNLSQLRDDGLVGDTVNGDTQNYYYENDIAGALVDSIYGSDMSSSPYGNEINGEGNANYIYAGNGINSIYLGDFSHKATDTVTTTMDATVLGGSGNQDLIGVGNGTETIIGGAVGSDTAAVTAIDGGGAKALLNGGGQNSVIYGGTGADTLVASSASTTSPSGFDPYTTALAGLSFWGDAYNSTVDGSGKTYDRSALPNITWSESSPNNAQVNLSLYQSDNTHATPFGLLGSSLDSGADLGTAALPHLVTHNSSRPSNLAPIVIHERSRSLVAALARSSSRQARHHPCDRGSHQASQSVARPHSNAGLFWARAFSAANTPLAIPRVRTAARHPGPDSFDPTA